MRIRSTLAAGAAALALVGGAAIAQARTATDEVQLASVTPSTELAVTTSSSSTTTTAPADVPLDVPTTEAAADQPIAPVTSTTAPSAARTAAPQVVAAEEAPVTETTVPPAPPTTVALVALGEPCPTEGVLVPKGALVCSVARDASVPGGLRWWSQALSGGRGVVWPGDSCPVWDPDQHGGAPETTLHVQSGDLAHDMYCHGGVWTSRG